MKGFGKCVPVRICLQIRNAGNASAKFRKTSEQKKTEKSLEISAIYRTFSAMRVNEAYVLKANLRLLADDILEGFPDSAILRIDIVLFCFFPYIEWLLLS